MASSDVELTPHHSIAHSEYLSSHESSLIGSPENAQPALTAVSRSRQLTILTCAFFDVFITIGLNQAYGIFLTYYLDPNKNASQRILPPSQLKNKALVAFVGTLAAGLTWGGSIFVNPLMARTKDPRKITLFGAVLLGLGYVLASFSRAVRPSALSVDGLY